MIIAILGICGRLSSGCATNGRYRGLGMGCLFTTARKDICRISGRHVDPGLGKTNNTDRIQS